MLALQCAIRSAGIVILHSCTPNEFAYSFQPIRRCTMEVITPDFLSALAAIVVIDLVLAGDNAIVIALAARNLPLHLKSRAIIWGTIGAIVVRTLLTLGVVWLL